MNAKGTRRPRGRGGLRPGGRTRGGGSSDSGCVVLAIAFIGAMSLLGAWVAAVIA